MGYKDLRHTAQSDHGSRDPGPEVQRKAVPGKHSLTDSLPYFASGAPVQRKAGSAGDAAHEAPAASAQHGFDTARPDLFTLFATPVQRKAGDSQAAAAPSAGGSSQSMPADVRAKMEGSLGADFSAVRIHEGPQAAAMGALAYTQGTDIHFAPGQYQPSSQAGQELLGHELTHVVQQSQGRVNTTRQAKGVAINDDPGLEHEADVMGARAARGEPSGMAASAVAQRATSQPVQRMKIRTTKKASVLSGATNSKHVVATENQEAAAKAAYAHSTFVTSADAITSVVDANDHNFTEENGAASARFDFDASVVVSLWNKTGGQGSDTVERKIDNKATTCEIGVKKTGDDKVQVTHFKTK
ncbi:MAG TPA: DUF4157 domain-containing protein [Kofleriaceae bacterium]